MTKVAGIVGRLLVAAGAVFVLATGLMVAPVQAVVDDPDLDTSGDYTYAVDTDAGLVRVTVVLSVTADRPNEPVANGVYQYYYEAFAMLVPTAATDVVVTNGAGTALTAEREPVDDFTDLLTIQFTNNIFYRQTADLTVDYTLRAGDAGSDSIVRVNPAYVSFAAWTSPNLEEATVTVELPASFSDESNALTPFETEATDNGRFLVADGIDPESYYALVSLVNDDGLQIDQLPLSQVLATSDDGDARTITIRYWPGDEAWRDHVAEGLEDGLPAMAQLINQPWPLEGDMQVTESFAPVLYGYAGWYDSRANAITITDVQDDHVLYHELAHVWFNRNLFTDRWILEGLAELYAAETEAIVEGQRPLPTEVSTSDADAIPLSRFDRPGNEAEEAWGYDASWVVMEQVKDEIGLDGLAQIIDAAADRRLSYPGDTEDGNTMEPVADWQRFLDLAENIQDVDEGPLTAMVEEWVLGPQAGSGETIQLERRGEARPRYRALAAAGGEWAPPFGVRSDMTEWLFDRAEGRMDGAEAALARRDALDRVVEPTGAELPDALEELYETSDEDYEALGASLSRAEAAGRAIRESHDRAAAPRPILDRIGLLGTDVEREQAEAVEAFTEGRLSAAETEAGQVGTIMDEAARGGLVRIGFVVASLAVIATAVYGVAKLSSRGRRRPGGPGGPGSGGSGPTSPIEETWPPPVVG